jgi:hypothetical protein
MSKSSVRARPSGLSLARLLHLYVSAFVAPSLVFFAATGALQTFRLPDRPAAPQLLVKLARVHKDDVFAPKPARKPPAAAATKHAEAPEPAPNPATEALKWFFALVSAGIAVTTLLGFWMGIKHVKRKGAVWVLVAAGAIAPIALIILA